MRASICRGLVKGLLFLMSSASVVVLVSSTPDTLTSMLAGSVLGSRLSKSLSRQAKIDVSVKTEATTHFGWTVIVRVIPRGRKEMAGTSAAVFFSDLAQHDRLAKKFRSSFSHTSPHRRGERCLTEVAIRCIYGVLS